MAAVVATQQCIIVTLTRQDAHGLTTWLRMYRPEGDSEHMPHRHFFLFGCSTRDYVREVPQVRLDT